MAWIGMRSSPQEHWDYISPFETHGHISEIYTGLHGLVDPDEDKIAQIASAFCQGRMYFGSAELAPLGVKPVLLYYGASALLAGLALARDARLTQRAWPSNHGLTPVGWRNILYDTGGDLLKLAVRATKGTFRHVVETVWHGHIETVLYATADGTATAGEDYTATNGTLTFSAGETAKTVSVPVLDDAHDEGSETMRLTLSNARGATIEDGEAVGTIVNNDTIPQAWLARFGRTVTGQVLDAVAARLTAPRAAGAEASLAGQALPSWRADGSPVDPDPGSRNGVRDRSVSGADGESVAARRDAPEGSPRADVRGRDAQSVLASMTAWLSQAGAANDDGAGGGSAGGFGHAPGSVARPGRDPISANLIIGRSGQCVAVCAVLAVRRGLLRCRSTRRSCGRG